MARPWNEDVMYMMVTDRFDNADPANDALNGPPAPGNPDGVHGGDIRGIERRLPLLKAMGFTAIWLTPVARNVPGAYHGYWIQNFLEVDPRLGTMADLKRMIRSAHALGMRVHLDIVCNHIGPLARSVTGEYHWSDAGRAYRWRDSTRLPSPAFFRNLDVYHNHGEVKEWRDPYQVLGELPGGLNDLRTERADVRDTLIAIWLWWMEETGCDGFRVDTVKHVDIGFWHAFLAALKEAAVQLRRRFFIFGEVFEYGDAECARFTAPDSLGRPGFDAVLNFSLSGSIRNVFAQHGRVSDIARSLANLPLYAPDARPNLLTFVDNHDIPRFMALAGGDTTSLERALTFLFALEGVPVIYYGTEQAFLGGDTHGGNREDLFDGQWKGRNTRGDGFASSSRIGALLRRLAEMRLTSPVLLHGSTTVLRADDSQGLLLIERRLHGTRAFILVNTSREQHSVAVPATGRLHAWDARERRFTPEAIPLPAESVTILFQE